MDGGVIRSPLALFYDKRTPENAILRPRGTKPKDLKGDDECFNSLRITGFFRA
jgi:hypothetical protein